MEDVRLQLYLSRSGVASRRASADIIQSGRVRVNGKRVTEPGHRVGEDDLIQLDGRVLVIEEEKLYLVLNKPSGVICTANDPEGRTSIYDLIANSFSQRLFSIGRLDFMSSGILLISNDGNFAHSIGHPRAGIIKKYRVDAREKIPGELLETWCSGIRVRGVLYRLEKFQFIAPKSVELSLTEGKNREIRNVFVHGNVAIKSLLRVQYGNLHLGKLKSGKFRNLSASEISNLLSLAAKNKKNSPSRRGKRNP